MPIRKFYLEFLAFSETVDETRLAVKMAFLLDDYGVRFGVNSAYAAIVVSGLNLHFWALITCGTCLMGGNHAELRNGLKFPVS